MFVEKIDGNSAKPNYTDAEVLAKKIIDLFENNEFGVCRVIFNKFVSAITQEVTLKSLIPVEVKIGEIDENTKRKISNVVPLIHANFKISRDNKIYKNQKVTAFAGIAYPEKFYNSLNEQGAILEIGRASCRERV